MRRFVQLGKPVPHVRPENGHLFLLPFPVQKVVLTEGQPETPLSDALAPLALLTD